MAGRKRAAAEDPATEKRETRSSKVAKTEGTKAAGKAAKGTARLKTSMAQSAFKSRAVPLHVSITTTAAAPEGQESVSTDPGFLASTTLVPSSFSTGSFGWKGHKRMVVELPKAEGQEEGEKVHVTLTHVFHLLCAAAAWILMSGYSINATVIGSKDVKEGEEHEGEGEKEGTGEHAEETSGEAVEPKHGGSPETKPKESEDTSPTGGEQAGESA